MKPSVIVWDLETVPDLPGFAAANDLIGKPAADIRAELGNKFPKHIYHTIVCIGALIAHRESDQWAVDALGAPHVGERTEKQLISSFCDKIAELKPQLVTFNGNSFDLPVLRYRAMIHGVSAPGLAARLYFNRYTEDAVDLCDILSAFAPHTKASLNELSKIMGLPGKPEGIDGTEVERYFLEGRIKKIADYCEVDVINTYRVWLRYELFRGRLTESEHQASERSLVEFIAARLNRAPHSQQAPEVGPELHIPEAEGSHRASAPAGKASIDTWVADLLDTPEKTRAASLYELLLRLNLNVSHLDEAREAYVRRLGLR
jgi:predicted PolB exonuclease-like 3'-5' exonuclease